MYEDKRVVSTHYNEAEAVLLFLRRLPQSRLLKMTKNDEVADVWLDIPPLIGVILDYRR